MSRAEKIAKMSTRTASQAKEASTVSRKKNRARNGVLFESHKHCVICSVPISIKNEPSICANEDCHANQKRKEVSRKRLTLLLYTGVAVFVVPLLLTVAREIS
jgi:predicted nucleic acid-binding Zn ribbon protein